MTPALNALAAVAAALALAMLYQYIASAIDRQRHAPPGQRVDVGGYRLHLRRAGEGPLTVVFDSGSGGFCLDWEAVWPATAPHAWVVLFDRAGYAWSDASPDPRDALHASSELRALLDQAGIGGPLILVGHSIGGLYAQVYAGRYSDQVAGLVLVDPAHRLGKDDLLDLLPADQRRAGERVYRRYFADAGGLVFFLTRLIVPPLGLFRLIGLLVGERLVQAIPAYHTLPAPLRPAYRAMFYRSAYFRARLDEGHRLNRAAAQARELAPSFGDLPLTVLSGDLLGGMPYRDDLLPDLQTMRPAHHAAHAALARLSTRGQHVIVARSAHYVHADRPDAVIEVIREMIATLT